MNKSIYKVNNKIEPQESNFFVTIRADNMKAQAQDYSQIDLLPLFEPHMTPQHYYQLSFDNIKPVKDINTARELEKEGVKLADALSDTNKDWQARLRALRRIQSMIVTQHVLDMPQLTQFLNKVSKPLAIQLTDKRSAITKETTYTIQLIASVLGEEFAPWASDVFLSELALYKLMQIANSVMAEQAHHCVLTILDRCPVSKVIDAVLKRGSSTRKQIRVNTTDYVLFMLMHYNHSLIAKYSQQFCAYLAKAMQDQMAEVRKMARLVFMRFYQLDPQACQELLYESVEGSYQKALYDEFVAFDIDPMTTGIFVNLEADQDQEAVDEQEPLSAAQQRPELKASAVTDATLTGSLILIDSQGQSIQGIKRNLAGKSKSRERSSGAKPQLSHRFGHRKSDHTSNVEDIKRHYEPLSANPRSPKDSGVGQIIGPSYRSNFQKQKSPAPSQRAGDTTTYHSTPFRQHMNLSGVTHQLATARDHLNAASDSDQLTSFRHNKPKAEQTAPKTAFRYKSPQHLSPTMNFQAQPKKEQQPGPSRITKVNHIARAARQSLGDDSSVTLHQLQAPDEEGASPDAHTGGISERFRLRKNNFMTGSPPKLKPEDGSVSHRYEARIEDLEVNRAGSRGGFDVVSNKEHHRRRVLSRLSGSNGRSEGQQRRVALGAAHMQSGEHQDKLEKLKRTYNVNMQGRKSPPSQRDGSPTSVHKKPSSIMLGQHQRQVKPHPSLFEASRDSITSGVAQTRRTFRSPDAYMQLHKQDSAPGETTVRESVASKIQNVYPTPQTAKPLGSRRTKQQRKMLGSDMASQMSRQANSPPPRISAIGSDNEAAAPEAKEVQVQGSFLSQIDKRIFQQTQKQMAQAYTDADSPARDHRRNLEKLENGQGDVNQPDSEHSSLVTTPKKHQQSDLPVPQKQQVEEQKEVIQMQPIEDEDIRKPNGFINGSRQGASSKPLIDYQTMEQNELKAMHKRNATATDKINVDGEDALQDQLNDVAYQSNLTSTQQLNTDANTPKLGDVVDITSSKIDQINLAATIKTNETNGSMLLDDIQLDKIPDGSQNHTPTHDTVNDKLQLPVDQIDTFHDAIDMAQQEHLDDLVIERESDMEPIDRIYFDFLQLTENELVSIEEIINSLEMIQQKDVSKLQEIDPVLMYELLQCHVAIISRATSTVSAGIMRVQEAVIQAQYENDSEIIATAANQVQSLTIHSLTRLLQNRSLKDYFRSQAPQILEGVVQSYATIATLLCYTAGSSGQKLHHLSVNQVFEFEELHRNLHCKKENGQCLACLTMGAQFQLSWRKLKNAYNQGFEQRKEDQARMSVLLQLLLSQIQHFGCEVFTQRNLKVIDEMADMYLPRIEPREPLSSSSILSKGSKHIFEYAVDEQTRLSNFQRTANQVLHELDRQMAVQVKSNVNKNLHFYQKSLEKISEINESQDLDSHLASPMNVPRSKSNVLTARGSIADSNTNLTTGGGIQTTDISRTQSIAHSIMPYERSNSAMDVKNPIRVSNFDMQSMARPSAVQLFLPDEIEEQPMDPTQILPSNSWIAGIDNQFQTAHFQSLPQNHSAVQRASQPISYRISNSTAPLYSPAKSESNYVNISLIEPFALNLSQLAPAASGVEKKNSAREMIPVNANHSLMPNSALLPPQSVHENSFKQADTSKTFLSNSGFFAAPNIHMKVTPRERSIMETSGFGDSSMFSHAGGLAQQALPGGIHFGMGEVADSHAKQSVEDRQSIKSALAKEEAQRQSLISWTLSTSQHQLIPQTSVSSAGGWNNVQFGVSQLGAGRGSVKVSQNKGRNTIALSDNSDFIIKRDGKAAESRISLGSSSNYQSNPITNAIKEEEEEMKNFEKGLGKHRAHTSALNNATTQMSTNQNDSSEQQPVRINDSSFKNSSPLKANSKSQARSSFKQLLSISQAKVESEDDIYEGISNLFTDLRQKREDVIEEEYLQLFKEVVLAFIEQHQDSILEDHLSSLLDELAESLDHFDLQQVNELFASVLLQLARSSTSGTTGETKDALFLQEQLADGHALEKVFTTLNLKMLNRSHPYFKHIVIILSYYVANVRATDAASSETQTKLFQLVSDNLAELVHSSDVQKKGAMQQVQRCVKLMQERAAESHL